MLTLHNTYPQCAIPVFDGILANESHSAATLSLLAVCAEWHALAKLRMHTDDTLQLLQDTTVKLGSEFRSFLDGVCQEVATEELDSEKEAREAQQKKTKAAQKTRNAKAAESSSPALQQVRSQLFVFVYVQKVILNGPGGGSDGRGAAHQETDEQIKTIGVGPQGKDTVLDETEVPLPRRLCEDDTTLRDHG